MPANHLHHAGRKPPTIRPLGPWLNWGWHGLFVPGHTSNQFLRFCLVGTSGVVVNSLVMWGLHKGLRLPYMFCSVGAYALATVNNFVWNKIFTFKDRAQGLWHTLRQYLRFVSVTLLGLAINLAVLAVLVERMGVHPQPANLAGVLVATLSNFVGNKLFAFRTLQAQNSR